MGRIEREKVRVRHMIEIWCLACPIHYYKPEKRELIRQVMRYSGPRMILHHPVEALRYLFEK